VQGITDVTGINRRVAGWDRTVMAAACLGSILVASPLTQLRLELPATGGCRSYYPTAGEDTEDRVGEQGWTNASPKVYGS